MFDANKISHESIEGKLMFDKMSLQRTDFNIEKRFENYEKNLLTIQAKIDKIFDEGKQKHNSVKGNLNNSVERRSPASNVANSTISKNNIALDTQKFLLSEKEQIFNKSPLKDLKKNKNNLKKISNFDANFLIKQNQALIASTNTNTKNNQRNFPVMINRNNNLSAIEKKIKLLTDKDKSIINFNESDIEKKLLSNNIIHKKTSSSLMKNDSENNTITSDKSYIKNKFLNETDSNNNYNFNSNRKIPTSEKILENRKFLNSTINKNISSINVNSTLMNSKDLTDSNVNNLNNNLQENNFILFQSIKEKVLTEEKLSKKNSNYQLISLSNSNVNQSSKNVSRISTRNNKSKLPNENYVIYSSNSNSTDTFSSKKGLNKFTFYKEDQGEKTNNNNNDDNNIPEKKNVGNESKKKEECSYSKISKSNTSNKRRNYLPKEINNSQKKTSIDKSIQENNFDSNLKHLRNISSIQGSLNITEFNVENHNETIRQKSQKEILPDILKNILDINKKTKSIKRKMSHAFDKIKNDFDNSDLREKKFKKEFNFKMLNNSDVFIEENPGRGYHLRNQKVFRDANLLNLMDGEYALKYKKHLMEKLNMINKEDKLEEKKKKMEKEIQKADKKFKKVENVIKVTEELKCKNLKVIEEFHSKYKNLNKN